MPRVLRYLFIGGASPGDASCVYTRSSSYTSDESAIAGVLPDEHKIIQGERVVWVRGVGVVESIDPPPPEPTLSPEEILDSRLRAAGMMTVPEMMGVTPMTQWEVQQGMDSIEFFAKWLDRRAAEFLRMRMSYELGDKDKNDELYEWVVAHAASFHEVRVQLRAVLPALFPGVPDEASAS